jgi:hypothetical protein
VDPKGATTFARGAYMQFVPPSGTEAFAISLWDREENAEAYNRGAYPEVAKSLTTVIDGQNKVEIFNVADSTFHNIAAAVGA